MNHHIGQEQEEVDEDEEEEEKHQISTTWFYRGDNGPTISDMNPTTTTTETMNDGEVNRSNNRTKDNNTIEQEEEEDEDEKHQMSTIWFYRGDDDGVEDEVCVSSDSLDMDKRLTALLKDCNDLEDADEDDDEKQQIATVWFYRVEDGDVPSTTISSSFKATATRRWSSITHHPDSIMSSKMKSLQFWKGRQHTVGRRVSHSV